MRSRSRVGTTVILVGLSLGSICFGQQQRPKQPVNDYPMLDADRVYRAGEKVQVDEPHGVYTGRISIDDYYFLRPVRVNESERDQNGVKGTLSASVRRATSPSWLAMTFHYGCDDRDLRVGRTELARSEDGRSFIVGDHNAVCELRPGSGNPQTASKQILELSETAHIGGISFQYPEGWKVEHGRESLTIAPASAHRRTQAGGPWLTHGIFAGPVPDMAADVNGIAEAVFRNFRRSSPYMVKVGSPEAVSVEGRRALVQEYRNPQPGAPAPENGLIVTVSTGGGFSYLVLFCPSGEEPDYFPLFRSILNSIQVNEREQESADPDQPSSPSQPAVYVHLPKQIVEKVCRGPEITSGTEYEQVKRVQLRLDPILSQDRQHRTYIALAQNNEINAWAANLNMTQSLICFPVAMVNFMGGAEGELAFIMAHEIGHTVDDQCKTQEGRLAIARSRGSLGAILGGLLGGEEGAAASSRVSQQRGCETRADEIGFAIFTAAGFNPYDAAGAFGRLEMYTGDASTGIFARLIALGSDHPMTPDRIKHMRSLLIQYAAKKPD